MAFEFAKITCGREINAKTGYSELCRGRALAEILVLPFSKAAETLGIHDEEGQFILYLEWDALRTVIAQYLGSEDDAIDADRCRISSIQQEEEGIEVSLVILPPKELPKILPCGLADQP